VSGQAAEIGLLAGDVIVMVDGRTAAKQDIVQMMAALPRPGWIKVERRPGRSGRGQNANAEEEEEEEEEMKAKREKKAAKKAEEAKAKKERAEEAKKAREEAAAKEHAAKEKARKEADGYDPEDDTMDWLLDE
jgi:hypothetical protein